MVSVSRKPRKLCMQCPVIPPPLLYIKDPNLQSSPAYTQASRPKMAKHRIHYVTFALLLVGSIGSSSRTSITTIEIDEENPTGQSLDACKRYLVQSSRPRSGWREEFQQCCEQLEEMDKRSRCEGIRRIAQQEKQQQGGSRGEEMQEMMQTARSLPGLCRMEPRRCEIRTLLWS
ncbi:hypothetical protein RJ640_022126 [Escallonia rubra]|uniref:Bifunctional inhibitor/plant lipid transfer protein/seed storage helical domain-containing protein n=1 Tax=Escallonia rubra TaxID=112253 RepID=A0AA88UWC2_9ASTE|nr:hypothetical protein RJ640_022126 [Escallonia rubra]